MAEATGIQLIYSTGWKQAFLHCKKNDETAWTDPPGIAFREVGKAGLRMAQIEGATKLQFVCTDGANRWDKAPGNQNYCIAIPGCYKLMAGKIERVGDYVHEKGLAGQPDPEPGTRQENLLDLVSSTASQSQDAECKPPDSAEKLKADDIVQQSPSEQATTRAGEVVLQGAIAYDDGLDDDMVTGCSTTLEAFCSLEPSESFAVKSMPSAASVDASSPLKSSTVRSKEIDVPRRSRRGFWGGVANVVTGAALFRRSGSKSVASKVEPQVAVEPPAAVEPLADMETNPTIGSQVENSRAQMEPREGAMVRRPSQSLILQSRSRSQGLLEEVDNVHLIYRTGWPEVFLHCRADMGAWTTLPGIRMIQVEKEEGQDDNLPTKWMQKVSGKTLEFALHNGKGSWDNANGKNYTIRRTGEYLLLNGQLKRTWPPPQPPILAVVHRVGPNSVELGWNPPDVEDGVERYRIYQEGIQGTVGETNATTRTCVVRNLKGAMTYRFKVTTVEEGNNESDGTIIEATTSTPGKPGAPTMLHITSQGIDYIELAWQPPQDIGGASVTAYHVFRDGVAQATVVSRNPETGEDLAQISWTDKTVTKGGKYTYTVSALHLPERTPSRSDLVEMLTKRASKSLLEVTPEDNEGPPCDPVEARAVSDLRMPKLGEQVTHVILQGFNWGSCDNKEGWYKVLLSKVSELQDAGFDIIWLPPPAKSTDRQGYLPSKWYDLNSNYGTQEDLIALGEALHEAGICPMLDLVVNHRCASKQDGEGKWSVFEQPDWGRWAICRGKDRNDPNNIGTGSECTGTPIPYAPNIDHRNSKIQKDVNDWVAWMVKTVGIRALRLDYVIGFEPGLQEMYVRAAGSPFAVAEYWHGDPEVLRNYVRATKGQVAVFDFPVYYALKNCVHNNDYGGLSIYGRPPGILGTDPVRSCTFIENHDTIHLAVVGGGFGNSEQIVRGHVYILTHPGTPTVFWSYWSDWGKEVRDKINACVKIRRETGLHSTSKCIIRAAEWGLYAAEIEGKTGGVAMKLGSKEWSPNGSCWQCAVFGNGFCVWVRR